jgi:acyl transferase domain-containing protein
LNTKKDPIAIVGMACRFPGGCDSPDKFWEILKNGVDLITEVNSNRWSKDYYFHPDPKSSGKTYTTAAGQLSDIYQFDPEFFGISPREAAQMDPQQRLLLQMSWEALENGGQIPANLAGTDCSVYVGISSLDYANNRMDDPNVADAYFMTGNTLSIAANRISYIYDLHGPSMAIDTACSSSLVALHQACSSIWAGESDSSIVGAIHLVLSPFPFIGFSKANMMADVRSLMQLQMDMLDQKEVLFYI